MLAFCASPASNCLYFFYAGPRFAPVALLAVRESAVVKGQVFWQCDKGPTKSRHTLGSIKTPSTWPSYNNCFNFGILNIQRK